MILEMTRVQILGIRDDLQRRCGSCTRSAHCRLMIFTIFPMRQSMSFQSALETQKSQEDSRYLITQLQGLIQTLNCDKTGATPASPT